MFYKLTMRDLRIMRDDNQVEKLTYFGLQAVTRLACWRAYQLRTGNDGPLADPEGLAEEIDAILLTLDGFDTSNDLLLQVEGRYRGALQMQDTVLASAYRRIMDSFFTTDKSACELRERWDYLRDRATDDDLNDVGEAAGKLAVQDFVRHVKFGTDLAAPSANDAAKELCDAKANAPICSGAGSAPEVDGKAGDLETQIAAVVDRMLREYGLIAQSTISPYNPVPQPMHDGKPLTLERRRELAEARAQQSVTEADQQEIDAAFEDYRLREAASVGPLVTDAINDYLEAAAALIASIHIKRAEDDMSHAVLKVRFKAAKLAVYSVISSQPSPLAARTELLRALQEAAPEASHPEYADWDELIVEVQRQDLSRAAVNALLNEAV